MILNTRLLSGLALACNIAVVVLVWISMWKVSSFRYFTILSNAFAGLCALVMLPFCAYGCITGFVRVPAFVRALTFTGSVSVAVTFTTVVLFLGPTQGYKIMFDGVSLYLHAIVPILSVLATVLFGGAMTYKQALCGCLPTIVYGILYAICVIPAAIWPDFYGFTFGGKMWVAPISFVAMQGLGYGLSMLIWSLTRIFSL